MPSARIDISTYEIYSSTGKIYLMVKNIFWWIFLGGYLLSLFEKKILQQKINNK